MTYVFFFMKSEPSQPNQPSPSVIKCFLVILLHVFFMMFLVILYISCSLEWNWKLFLWLTGVLMDFLFQRTYPFHLHRRLVTMVLSVVNSLLWMFFFRLSLNDALQVKIMCTCTFYKVFISDTLTFTTIFIIFSAHLFVT